MATNLFPAFNVQLGYSGIPTDFSGEPMTTNDGIRYTINDKVKSVWDTDSPITIAQGNDAVTPDLFNIDYMTGTITFHKQRAGALTVSGKYMPTVLIAGANQYSLNIIGDVLDGTDFARTSETNGYRYRTYGLTDVNLSVSRFSTGLFEFIKMIKLRRDVYIEIITASRKEKIRGRFVIESDNQSGDVSGLETEELSFQLNGGDLNKFSWRNI